MWNAGRFLHQKPSPVAVKRSGVRCCVAGTSPGRLVCTPPFAGPSSLPTIVGSPSKMPSGFHFPTTAADVTGTPPGGVLGALATAQTPSPSGSTSGPIHTPFGHNRNKTYPDNIAAIGFTVDGKGGGTRTHDVIDSQHVQLQIHGTSHL